MQLCVGTVVEGKVSKITGFGAFVDIDGGGSGMVHISEVANTYVKDINDHLKVGDAVKAKVVAINENNKIALSIKALLPPEPKPQPEEEKPQEEKPSGMGGLVVFFAVVLLGGGAALYFLKFKKEKADTTGNDDLTEYDFGEDEDDEDEAPEPDEDMTDEDGNKEDEV